jgi:hypothetical protein
MLDTDKPEFATLVRATLKTYRAECDADVLRLWWGVLVQYGMDEVRAGFTRYVSSRESKFAPVPANIIDAIEASRPDGRPGAEEAWAMYPHDEYASAVITDEIAEAMRVARPLIDDGDRIGARMAFKEAYGRIVAVNKANGVPVRWFPSLGADKEGREDAMCDAVAKGRITQTHAESLLPAPKSMLENMLPEMKLLTAKDLTEEQREKAHARMEEIKAMLKGQRA